MHIATAGLYMGDGTPVQDYLNGLANRISDLEVAFQCYLILGLIQQGVENASEDTIRETQDIMAAALERMKVHALKAMNK